MSSLRFVVVCALSACIFGGGGDAPTSEGRPLAGPDGEPIELPEAPPQDPDDEVFALYERVVELASNPIPGNNNTRDSETYALKRLVHTPGEAVYREQLCATWGNEVFGVTWSFAADFPELRGIQERPLVTLDDQTFEAGPYPDLLGTDVETGPLPDDPDDPGVVDLDQDGEPGVTVFIDGPISGETYIAQRSTTALRGDWVEADTATGPIDTEVESNTLGASNILLRIDPPTEPQPDKSFFVLMRIDPELDCAAIDAQ
ncbi:MAG: hypothetical protein AAF602_30595, partial [Myxococcota bacterium]